MHLAWYYNLNWSNIQGKCQKYWKIQLISWDEKKWEPCPDEIKYVYSTYKVFKNFNLRGDL